MLLTSHSSYKFSYLVVFSFDDDFMLDLIEWFDFLLLYLDWSKFFDFAPEYDGTSAVSDDDDDEYDVDDEIVLAKLTEIN